MGHAKDNSGIWGHSSAIGANSYIVFSVGDDLIQMHAFMGWCAAQSIGLKPIMGSYKGKTEQSFIVNYGHLGQILNAGWLRGQESILVLGACNARDQRPARLHYLTIAGDDLIPNSDDLGVLQSVTREEALKRDAWSYDPTSKEYFICIDPDAITLCPFGIGAVILEHGGIGEHVLEDIVRTYLKARRTV